MFIERPPKFLRRLFPDAIWLGEQPPGRPTVYLTFDDGPIPEVTPWVLDTLDRYGIKATFFMVGDNVLKYPALKDEVLSRGHSIGNHTMHHVQGLKTTLHEYLRDILEADALIGSALFRPPHGVLTKDQESALKPRYKIVMYDLITRDYDRSLSPEQVLDNVKQYTRNGSIIVFHDSVKTIDRLRWALPRAIEWLKEQGYEFGVLPM